MTIDTILALPGEAEFNEALFTLLDDMVPDDGIAHLSEPARVLYLVLRLDAEIGPGGMAQYLDHASGNHLDACIAALFAIGSDTLGHRMRAVSKAFPRLCRERNPKLRQALLDQLDDIALLRLDRLSNVLLADAYPEDGTCPLYDNLRAYAKLHQASLCDGNGTATQR